MKIRYTDITLFMHYLMKNLNQRVSAQSLAFQSFSRKSFQATTALLLKLKLMTSW